jgi:hypothetical protein
MSPFDSWRRYVLAAVEQIGKSLGPDDDWMPTLLLDTDAGLAIMPLEGDLAEHGALPQIAALMVAQRATFAARVQMSWQISGEDSQRFLAGADTTRPTDHPNRTEHVTAILGDASELEGWDALVTRDERGVPSLGKWVAVTPDGPVAQSMRGALIVAQRQN